MTQLAHRPRRGDWHPHLGRWTGLLAAAPGILLLSVFVLYPLVRVLYDASVKGAALANYAAVFAEDISRRALVTTLTNSAVVALVTTFVGMLLAWALHTTERRWVRVMIWITVLVPFTMGTIIKNYAILLLLVANGPLNGVLLGLGLIDQPLSLLYTPFAVIYGISYSLLPYATMTLLTVFAGVDRNLLTSAQVLGASRVQTAWTIVLPLIRNGLVTTLALIFVLSVGFYVTPVLLGGLQNPFVATVINQQIFLLYDYPGAAANAVVVLVLALVVMAVAVLFSGRKALREVLR